MISDSQVAELFAEANPVPTFDALDVDEATVGDGTQSPTAEGSRGMKTADTEHRKRRWRRPLIVAALAVAIVAVIAVPALLQTDDPVDVAVPPSQDEQEALQVTQDFVAALTRGDVDAAMALMTPEQQEAAGTRGMLEFMAAVPGSKTVIDCKTSQGPSAVSVACTLTLDGPVLQAAGSAAEPSRFTVKDGLVSTMINPGSRDAAEDAFVEYVTLTQPEAYEAACSPDSYDPGSVRVSGDGFSFAGPCGELWAEVSDLVAAWVRAGKPDLPDEG